MNSKVDELKKKMAHEADLVHTGAADKKLAEEKLSTKGLESAKPDRHFRRVRADKDAIARARKAGYEAVSDEEAREHGVEPHHEGVDVLMVTSRENHERRTANKQQKAADRLLAPKREFERVVEGVARELRDRYGVKVTDKDLMDV